MNEKNANDFVNHVISLLASKDSMERIEQVYKKTVVPALQKQFSLGNVFEVPKICKISLNVGIGKSLKDPNYLSMVEGSLTRIAGQKPVRTKAKKSIASFKIREGMVVGLSVTLRKKRMYDFLDKLVHVVLPRVRDFRGLDSRAVDRQGNFSIGFRENLAFPEIRSDEIENTHGLEVTIATNARDREKGLVLFTLLGFPFKKTSEKRPVKTRSASRRT